MNGHGGGPGRAAARARPSRWLVPVLLAATLATGCNEPFDPFGENTAGPFSVFGYLDLKADTQWIRVMPIRHQLLSDAAPIDAVVTLEHLGSGRVVTLRDSLFTFADPRLDAVGYAHNFWTTEPIEPEARYLLRAVRSDGAATTAVVEMPPDLEASLRHFENSYQPGVWVPRQIFVSGEHLLHTDVLYTVWDETGSGRPAPPVAVRVAHSSQDHGTWGFVLPGVGPFDRLNMPPFLDVLRREARVAVAGSDWPYEPGLSANEMAIPGNVPSTVENGLGSLVGVATWTIPLPLCTPMEGRPDGGEHCRSIFDASSASIVGKVTRDPCGDPMHLPTVRLTEWYPDGGADVWEWKADWSGAYRFEGLEPGADLLLEFPGHPAGARYIRPLRAGERYFAPDVTLPNSCASGEGVSGAVSGNGG